MTILDDFQYVLLSSRIPKFSREWISLSLVFSRCTFTHANALNCSNNKQPNMSIFLHFLLCMKAGLRVFTGENEFRSSQSTSQEQQAGFEVVAAD